MGGERLRLGLLQCDPRPFPEMFAAWMPEVEWEVYPLYADRFPAGPRECDGWVSTGSKQSVYDEDAWIGRFAELVRQWHAERAPFVGVCFGHQMIGHALGGRTAKAPVGWCAGTHTFAVRQQQAWMEPRAERLHVIMSCQDQILELPPGTEVLASSADCPNGVIQLGTMVGIQGHPEFTPDYSRELLGQRRERIGAEKADRAAESLVRYGAEQAADSRLLAEWTERFVRQVAGL